MSRIGYLISMWTDDGAIQLWFTPYTEIACRYFDELDYPFKSMSIVDWSDS